MEHQTYLLVISPHPDDCEFGVAGTVARLVKEGKPVVYIICTNGDKGTSDRNLKPEQLALIREKEQLAAAQLLGVKRNRFSPLPGSGTGRRSCVQEGSGTRYPPLQTFCRGHSRPLSEIHLAPRPSPHRLGSAGRCFPMFQRPPGLSGAARRGAGTAQGQGDVVLGRGRTQLSGGYHRNHGYQADRPGLP